MDDRLKIVYMSHYFPPEVNAPALRVSELSSRWASNGVDVTVLTGFPNHPTGVIPAEYKGRLRQVEQRGKLKVVRTHIYAAANKGFLRRILNYLSFMFSSILLGSSKIGRPDVIVGTSPQFFVAVAAYVLSRIKKSKFIFEVRDVWPEEIVAVGAIRNRLIIGVLERLEMFLYHKADLIVAVAQGTVEILASRGVPLSKIVLISNGVDIRKFEESEDGRRVRQELGFEDKFVVSYIGTHGMAHKLDTILSAAFRLQKHSDIQFLFVGEGAEKQKLSNMARELELSNVHFHDQIPHERIPEFYRASDLLLVPLRKAQLFTKNVPSKIYEIMASRKPILISTEGESRRLVESTGAGLGAAPEDVDEIARKILHLSENGSERERMGLKGHEYVIAHADRNKLADNYLKIIEKVAVGKELSNEEHASLEVSHSSATITEHVTMTA